MHTTSTTTRTVLAEFRLQHTDDTGALVDSPVTVVAHDAGPGTAATFTVERHGEVMFQDILPAEFGVASEAMTFALDIAGWLQAIA